jgi:hypothetical protein
MIRQIMIPGTDHDMWKIGVRTMHEEQEKREGQRIAVDVILIIFRLRLLEGSLKPSNIQE